MHLMFGRDSDAVVRERHHDLGTVRGKYGAGVDVTAGGRIFQTVFEENAQQLAQQNGIRVDDRGSVCAERDLMRGRDHLHLLDRIGEEFGQIHILLVDGLTLLISAREEEQLFDELLHILRLRADGGDALIEDVLILAAPAREHVGVAEDHRERRAQLVRSIGDKALLLLESFLQTVQHAVECAGELGELIARARHVEAPAEALHLNAARCPCDLADRL